MKTSATTTIASAIPTTNSAVDENDHSNIDHHLPLSSELDASFPAKV
jgi:hypothetical protein